MRTALRTATLVVALAAAPSHAPLAAQQRPQSDEPIVRIEGLRLPSMIWTRAADRAALGVTLGAASSADTAGVKIDAVRENGPAAKAGIKAGDLITDINGVSLKVGRDDAEDLALAGMAQRRLQRVLGKARPGDEVELRVRSGGGSPRAMTVKTVSAAELEDGPVRRVVVWGGEDGNRAAVGVTVSGAGNARDTLGLFVGSVVTAGPAEKAGLVEGERISAVNGVDLRVPKEDLDDPQVRSARVTRFLREVQKVAPGGTVTLRVVSGGRTRDVAVQTVRASDLPDDARSMPGGGRIILNGRVIDVDRR
ncbi:PDZ domain-containing protein [Gemmatimonas groenlandica]|uniref:PDZ domain-containing protein n=1 Tax=Gemmatimonas groenlandica TaxID=2732249 RepID=A0A6M4INH5_9BACT|nr:PDZ domain-containing protein [Gemmatimonas groenlandica]QJR36270.1 PDZ domain-containing protein [Gemmatimonas groenlandica]